MSEVKEASFFEEPVDFGRPIVTRGRVFSFPLRSSIRKSNIGAGDCPSIVWDRQNSAFYGVVTGEESHIFLFDSNSTIEDVGKVEGVRALSGFLVFDEADHLLCCLTDGGGDTFVHIFWRRYRSDVAFGAAPVRPFLLGLTCDPRWLAAAAVPDGRGVRPIDDPRWPKKKTAVG